MKEKRSIGQAPPHI